MFYDTTTAAGHGPRGTGLFTIATQPWQMFANLMMQRRTYTTLSRLDDHMLKDIGVSRGEIERISRNPAL